MGADAGQGEALTARQFEVLGLMAKGYSNPEICGLLKLSINTVKVHVAGVLDALHVSNRTEAASVYYSLLNETGQHEPARRARLVERIGCPAICVLPFDEQPAVSDFFAEGLVEDLILRLSAWRWFPVIASGASRNFNLRSHGLQQIREKLGADYVVSGSLRRFEGRARITVNLASARDGRIIWSDSFDRDLGNLLATQDEISRVIVARIAPELLDLEARLPTAASQAAPDAWRLAVCGFAHVSRRERARFEQAVAAFDSAISIDEGFALAHYGRAHAYYLAMVEQWLPEPTAFPEFRRSASRAMELDPGSCGSQMMCGLALLFAGDLAAAYTHVREAVAINPSSCLALGLLGQLSLMRGQAQQAIAHLEEALRLGPRDPGAWLHYVTLAMAYFALRQPDAGAENCRHAITLRTDSALPRVTLIACLQEAGKEAECAAATRELLALHPEFRISAFLRLVRTAHPDDRQRLAAALAASGLSD